MQPKTTSWIRYFRAPVFLPVLALSFIPIFFVFASVTTGGWCEDFLRLLGYRSKPTWLPGVLGILVYGSLGVFLPVYIGSTSVGWVGGVIAPLVVLGVIAKLGNW